MRHMYDNGHLFVLNRETIRLNSVESTKLKR